MIVEKCPYCTKRFKGKTKHQVDVQVMVHKITKHTDKIKMTEENGKTKS
jgi:hypothetical protein